MTPTLLNKYLGAAQFVSDHLVLKTTGIAFAPFPVTSYNERKKLTEQAIIDFYRAHTCVFGDHLEAAWAATAIAARDEPRHVAGGLGRAEQVERYILRLAGIQDAG